MYSVLVCVLFASVTAVAHDLKFDYQITEGKARFVEEVKTNLGKNIVTFHVPAHNNVLESYKMQDFKEGKQITCLPALRKCKLRDIDRETAVDAGKITESFVHSWNQGVNSISSKDSKVIRELYYIDGEEIVDTVSLGNELRQFFDSFGYPLYQERKVPNDAEILNITRSAESRIKRYATLNNDCRGQVPKRKYGIDDGTACNYLKICKQAIELNGKWVFADCGNVHIESPMVYKCICCPWVTAINLAGDECACEEMKDELN